MRMRVGGIDRWKNEIYWMIIRKVWFFVLSLSRNIKYIVCMSEGSKDFYPPRFLVACSPWSPWKWNEYWFLRINTYLSSHPNVEALNEKIQCPNRKQLINFTWLKLATNSIRYPISAPHNHISIPSFLVFIHSPSVKESHDRSPTRMKSIASTTHTTHLSHHYACLLLRNVTL